MSRKHINILLLKQGRECIGSCAEVEKTSLFRSLFDPCIVIAVAVEDNSLVILDGLFNHVMESGLKIVSALKTVCINFKALCNCGVKHDVCASNAVCRAEHTEFKLVSRESKR